MSKPESATTHPKDQASRRIAIIGGGLGGLTLARVLQVKGIPCKVFEQESSAESRSQGGTLDIHEGSGQHALKLARLFDKFEEAASYEAQCTRIVDKAGVVHMDHKPQPGQPSRPEIDRKVLRQILLDSLTPNTISWDHRLTMVESLNDKTHQLTFDNGFVGTYDLVVGADGTWSRVRPLLSRAEPKYTGVTSVEFNLDDIDAAHPDLAAVIGGGSLFALGDNQALIAQRNSGHKVKAYASLRIPESQLQVSFSDDPAAARAQIQDLFKDWNSNLTDMIRYTSNGFIPRPLYALPTGHSWTARPGITIIGDAAHVMSPFAGEGANLAMIDGADLGLAIATASENESDSAIAQVEERMCQRAACAAEESAGNLEAFIHPDAPATALKRIAEVMAGHRA